MGEVSEIIDTGVVVEESSSRGHRFRFAFSVLNLVNVQPYTFKQDIETKCENLPTSWSLEFMYEQKPDTSIVPCTITARRTDSMNRTVKADIEMCYSFLKNQSYQLEQLFVNVYKPGQEIREYSNDILPFPEQAAMYLDGGITVEVSLTIGCCDPE